MLSCADTLSGRKWCRSSGRGAMPRVLVSHARDDAAAAKSIAKTLERARDQVWLDSPVDGGASLDVDCGGTQRFSIGENDVEQSRSKSRGTAAAGPGQRNQRAGRRCTVEGNTSRPARSIHDNHRKA